VLAGGGDAPKLLRGEAPFSAAGGVARRPPEHTSQATMMLRPAPASASGPTFS
jgi:hypothetical protein